MLLNKIWNAKEIVKFFNNNRSTYNSLYKGEKYLISKYIKKNESVLDIGCAQGGMYKILKKKFKKIDYTGVDFNKKMINLAKNKCNYKKFYFYKNKNYLNFFKKKFDVVIIFGILHLNYDWKNILINAHKVAKKKILFDLRFSLLKKISTNYLSLNLDNKNKKSLVPYILLNKSKFSNFFKKKFKDCKLDIYSYTGKPSKYSSIKTKVSFANCCLKKI
jgi:ubiquinone/menaquinone biosynthesis C-methylase UbiE